EDIRHYWLSRPPRSAHRAKVDQPFCWHTRDNGRAKDLNRRKSTDNQKRYFRRAQIPATGPNDNFHTHRHGADKTFRRETGLPAAATNSPGGTALDPQRSGPTLWSKIDR